MAANAIRGEVDLDLAGVTFTLRPSYEAIVACEAQVGMALTEMTLAADRGALTLNEAAIIVTELVKAWGKETGMASARGVNATKIAKLIFDVGVMDVLPRIAIVLLKAASGGVDVEEKKKPIPEMIPPNIGDNLPGSPPPPSGGRRKSSGRARAGSSGRRSTAGNR